MVKRKIKKTKIDMGDIESLQGLIEADNNFLDDHLPNYLNPTIDKMRVHIEEKVKNLTDYATKLQQLSGEDVGVACLDGVIDELSDIKTALKASLSGTLDFDNALNVRSQILRSLSVSNVELADLVQRLERVQKILNTTFMGVKLSRGN